MGYLVGMPIRHVDPKGNERLGPQGLEQFGWFHTHLWSNEVIGYPTSSWKDKNTQETRSVEVTRSHDAIEPDRVMRPADMPPST